MKIFNLKARKNWIKVSKWGYGGLTARRRYGHDMRYLTSASDAKHGDVEIKDGGKLTTGPRCANFRYFPIGE